MKQNGLIKNLNVIRFNQILIVFILSVFVLTLIAGIVGLPFEDAAITYNYSQNLADSGVISYVLGGERAEGATDFAWMILIAFLQKLGFQNHFSSSCLNIFFLVVFAFRLISISKILQPSLRLRNVLVSYSSFLGIIFVTGAVISGLGGFATLAQISLLATIFVSFVFNRFDRLFIASSSFFILLRPDSIAYYLAVLIPFSIFNLFSENENMLNMNLSGTTINNFGEKIFKSIKTLNFRIFKYQLRKTIIPVIVFLSYWLIRAIYFQKKFPLPYYVKQVYESNISTAIYRLFRELITNGLNNISLSIILMIAILLCTSNTLIENGDSEKNNIDLDIKLSAGCSLFKIGSIRFWQSAFIGWSFFFITQSLYLSRFHLQQNVWDRFHAPLLAISAALMACFLLLYSQRLPIKGGRSVLSFVLIGFLFLSSYNVTTNGGYMGLKRVALGYKYFLTHPKNDNIYQLGLDLRDLHKRKKINQMYVTEAGRLTYYSRIPTVDTWGLNTPRYSSVPLQNPEDIYNGQPDIMVMHTGLSWLVEAFDNNLSFKDFNVGRSCKSVNEGVKGVEGVPPHLCGIKRTQQAMFTAGYNLQYDLYLVPHLKDDSDGRYQVWMINPKSDSAEDLRKTLVRRKAIKISSPRKLIDYIW